MIWNIGGVKCPRRGLEDMTANRVLRGWPSARLPLERLLQDRNLTAVDVASGSAAPVGKRSELPLARRHNEQGPGHRAERRVGPLPRHSSRTPWQSANGRFRRRRHSTSGRDRPHPVCAVLRSDTANVSFGREQSADPIPSCARVPLRAASAHQLPPRRQSQRPKARARRPNASSHRHATGWTNLARNSPRPSNTWRG